MFGLAKNKNSPADDADRKGFWIPERRLLAAVLHRAVTDLTGSDPRMAQEAHDWIFEEVIEPYQLFSFAWVCEQLELDSSIISSAISCLPQQLGSQKEKQRA